MSVPAAKHTAPTKVRMRTLDELRALGVTNCGQVNDTLKHAHCEEWAQFLGKFVEVSSPRTREKGRCDLPNALYWPIVDRRILDMYPNPFGEIETCAHILEVD